MLATLCSTCCNSGHRAVPAVRQRFRKKGGRKHNFQCLKQTSPRFNSCLPAEITVYKEPPKTVSTSHANKLKTRVVQSQCLLPHREAAVAIYSQIMNLPKASFANCRLHLPCIIFIVDRLTLVADEPQWRVYRATIGEVTITTADTLPLREPHGLLLVHPWIHDLLHLPGEITPDCGANDNTDSSLLYDVASLAIDDHACALGLIARLELKFCALL